MEFSPEKTAKELAKGAGILFAGILLMYILRFFYRIVVSRYLGPENYGLLTLGDMVMNLGYLVALIGLDVGLVRHLAYYKEKGDISRLKGSFWGTIIVSVLLSSILIFLLILFSQYIAIGLFKNPKFIPVLIIFSLAIPLSILVRIISQTLLAFKKQSYDFYATVLGRDLSSFLLVIFITLVGGTVIGISLTYLLALGISIGVGYLFLEKKVFPFLRNKVKPLFEFKERIFFSLPLFFSAVFISIMQWIDTFFLGYLRSIKEVGIYNVALPLAASMGIFLASFSRVFYPIIAGMIARKQEQEIPGIYTMITKWIFMLSFPILSLIILFPNRIIQIFFGSEYLPGSLALVILSLAYFINIITGPTFETLISFKKTKTVFWLNAGAVSVNIILNLILIPLYGITGAALATGITIGFREIISFILVKRLIGLKLRIKPYLKILSATILAILSAWLIFSALNNQLNSVIALVFCTLVIFVISYLVLLFILRVLDKNDYIILDALEKKLHLNLAFIKKRIFK